MARKTKEEAQETRNAILEAAVRVFAIKGVARTSLDDIAREAGVTRGAIYWHFANKADLLNTLWDQVLLFYAPLAEASENPDEPDPLGKMKALYLSFFTGMMATWAPAYCISKTALNALTVQTSLALTARGIAVNAVCPGWVRTDMGGADAPRSVEEGAASILWQVLEAPQEITGGFFRDGRPIPW